MRYLAWFALPFSAAVLAACMLPLWWCCWLVPVLIALIALSVWMRWEKQRVRLVLAAAGAAAAFLWFGIYTTIFVLPGMELEGKSTGFDATVTSYCAGNSVYLRFDSGLGEGKRVLTYLDADCSKLEPGDRVIGTARFARPDDYALSAGVHLVAQAKVESVYAASEVPLRYFPAFLGQKLKSTAEELFPGEPGALLRGLLTGDKSALSEGIYSDFRRAGIAHLLAVSGLHVGFLVGIFCLFPGQRRRRVCIAIPTLLCFAVLTGGQPSVWRAVVMAALLLIAPLFRRESDGITSIAAALFLLLVQNPYAATNIGLQLSFGAVAGLACFNTKLYDWMTRPLKTAGKPGGKRRRGFRVWKLVAGSLSSSLSAQVFTLPLVAWNFKTISLASPAGNLLSIWPASLAFGLGLVTCVIHWIFPSLALLLAVPVRCMLQYLLAVAGWLGAGRYSALGLDNFYYTAWFVVTLVLILLVILIKPLRARPVLPVSCAVMLLFLALTFRFVSLAAPPLSVTALDVGQGSCTVFGSKGSYVVVDCGGDEAGDRLADLIQSAGGGVSLLVLTHFDEDHVGGVERLLDRIEVEMIALPDVEDDAGARHDIEVLAKEHGCFLLKVDRTATVTFGEAELAIYPPVDGQTDNSSCLAVLCSWNGHHTLVTGDLGTEEELALLEREEIPDLDILVVGHHGSKNSTAARMLAQLRPDCALISVGDNQYHFPSVEVLEKLDAYRCTIYRTDLNGTVTIRYRQE